MKKFRGRVYVDHLTANTDIVGAGLIGASDLADGVITPAKGTTALKTKYAHTMIGDVSTSANRTVFAAPYSGCVISAIGIIVDTQIVKSLTTAYVTWQVVNMTRTEDLMGTAAATAMDTNNFTLAADFWQSLGVDQNLTLTAGDILELQVTVSGSPTGTPSKLACGVRYY